MSAPDAGGPLPHALLGRLTWRPDDAVLDAAVPGGTAPGGTAPGGTAADPELLARDIALLRESGYLKLAVPAQLGGAGLNLSQVACAQRQLAVRAPAAALAVTAHHAWVGAAADTLADPAGDASDPVVEWLLSEAARGRFFASGTGGIAPPGAGHWGPANAGYAGARSQRPAHPGTGRTAGGCGLDELAALACEPPGWDWLDVQAAGGDGTARPARVHAFVSRADASRAGILRAQAGQADPGLRTARALPPGAPGDTFVAGTFGWGLPLAGMTFYAIARRAFDLAVERAHRQTDGDHTAGRPGPGHPLDRWPVAEAALRLDSIRSQLDEVIHDGQQRTAAGGALTSLDPGGQWLIRLFTARHAAADGARRVIELAVQITEPPGPGEPCGGCAASGTI